VHRLSFSKQPVAIKTQHSCNLCAQGFLHECLHFYHNYTVCGRTAELFHATFTPLPEFRSWLLSILDTRSALSLHACHYFPLPCNSSSSSPATASKPPFLYVPASITPHTQPHFNSSPLPPTTSHGIPFLVLFSLPHKSPFKSQCFCFVPALV